ncbi:rngB, partial [Symbiodinium pilosum]
LGERLSDVWALELKEVMAWKKLQPTGPSPSGRHEHSAIYDPESHSMLIFGGMDGSDGHLSDVWALDLKVMAWKKLQPTGTSPSGRMEHSAIYDPESHSMLIFGGMDGLGKRLSDVWALELEV